jgi:hypothetical protein
MKTNSIAIVGAFVLGFGMVAQAEINIVVGHNRNQQTVPGFKFQNVPSPARGDAAANAKFVIVDGDRDRNGGDVDKLRDGRVPASDDQPSENFFFRAGSDGGRLLLDLGSVIDIKQVNTHSWHSGTRGPQVYKLFASDGNAADFSAQPKRGTDPEQAGWKQIARVDTRTKENEAGGQHGVSISDSGGALGRYRYLLFDISRTEDADPFGNTFYSEIDVIDRNAPEVAEAAPPPPPSITKIIEAEGGKYQFTLDTSAAPDLTEWAEKELAPVVQAWYPKLVQMLPSEGYSAPTRVTILFREDMGGTPASASGSRINCNIGWFRRNLKGEARGAVVHEMAHIVQQYGLARRNNPNATRTPGWLVEGIPDYIRWFLYEPETKGAEITSRNIARAKYDANYRITGNFLNWVTEKYDKDLARKLNAAAREGKYNEDLWKNYTGKTVQELGDEWKKIMEEKVAAQGAVKQPADEKK